MTQTEAEDMYDRRMSSARDTAAWVRDGLAKQKEDLDKLSLSVNVGFAQMEGLVGTVEEKIDELRKILLNSIPNGDPEKHLHHHIRLEVKEQEEIDAVAKQKKEAEDTANRVKNVKWAVIGTTIMTIVGFIGYLMSMGVAAMFQSKVQDVEKGKSVEELRHLK